VILVYDRQQKSANQIKFRRYH